MHYTLKRILFKNKRLSIGLFIVLPIIGFLFYILVVNTDNKMHSYLFDGDSPQTIQNEKKSIDDNITDSTTQSQSPSLVKIEHFIKRGDTIINALTRDGISYQAAHQFFTDVKPVYDLRKIGTGKKYILYLSESDRELEKFRYEIEANCYLEVVKDHKNNAYKGKLITIPYVTKRDIIKGEIDFSLFQSILDSGEKPELADMLASLYEYDIDFNRDIHKKDSFAVIVEKKYLNGKMVTYGDIIASEFINQGRVIRLVLYTDPDGTTAYYHPDGRSARKMFLRCPLPFMRVTSRYGFRRHPVLGFSARHCGVDLAAPQGTRIRATASGRVIKTGYHSAKGRHVVIRHPNHYITQYYHLRSIAKNIKAGVAVEQGQIIGYVGNTGLSTGPHLHYGVKKGGQFMNPLSLKSPTKNPVKPQYLAQFKQYATGHFLLIYGSQYVDIPSKLKDVLLKPTPGKAQPPESGNAIKPTSTLPL